MVEKLKDDNHELTKENHVLRAQNDQLKRWIGKRAKELGLDKHVQREDGHKKMAELQHSSGSPLIRGDPSLPSVTANEELMADSKSTGGAESPKSLSPPPPSSPDGFQPVGIRTTLPRPQLQTPWLVEQPADEKGQCPEVDGAVEEVALPGTAEQHMVTGLLTAPQRQVAEEQQIVYLPKDTILIVQGQEGQQPIMTAAPALQEVIVGTPQTQAVIVETPQTQEVIVGTPQMQEVIVGTPQTQEVIVGTPQMQVVEVSGNISSSMVALRGDAKEAKMPAAEIAKSVANTGKENVSPDTTPSCEPSEATAVESLLKLGYKIEKPQLAPEAASCAALAPEETSAVPVDHCYEAPHIITVPDSALESTGTVTVTTTTTTKDTASKHCSPANSSSPLINGLLQADVISKLREIGFVFAPGEVVSTIRVGSA